MTSRRMAWLAALLAGTLLAGCVTETTGVREPAAPDVQLRAQLDLARGYLEQREWSRAREPLARALDIDSRSAEALALMAVSYQGQQEDELAEQYYRRALRADPRHARTLNNYAAFLYAKGRYRDAVDPLRMLVRDPSYPDRARAYESLGLTELRIGNDDRARDAFERALSINPQMPRSSLELAQLGYEAGDYAAASRYYETYRLGARQTPTSLCLGLRLARISGNADQVASHEIALRNLFPNSTRANNCLNER
ncbi:MAG: type IV pilus biogenesis/stability protein PilW [Pseudomonadales bacterium]